LAGQAGHSSWDNINEIISKIIENARTESNATVMALEQSTKQMTWIPPWLRAIYLVILVPHLLLAVGMLPMIYLAFYRASRRQWDRHRRIAKPTFFIWLYVSVTGVVIYWMLYHLFPSMKG